MTREEHELSIKERFRQSHHAIAGMFARGFTASKISRLTGRSMRSLGLLYNNPMFQELIVQKSKAYERVEEEFIERAIEDEYTNKAIIDKIALTTGMMKLDMLEAKLDAGEYPSFRDVHLLHADALDRGGFSKHTTIHHEHGFASQLDRAIRRSNKTKEVQEIEGQIVEAQLLPARAEQRDQSPDTHLVAPPQAEEHKTARSTDAPRPSIADLLKVVG
jgi:hypothetical protein